MSAPAIVPNPGVSPEPASHTTVLLAHLELCGVTKSYRAGETEVKVLHGIDLRIAHGERVVIMGRSGSGKSTLLNILGALDVPSSGQYLVNGADVGVLSDKHLSKLRNRNFGFVFQSFHLLAGLDIVQNVQLPMEYSDIPEAEQRARALELLEMVGLSHRTSHRPNELSGGERQRVAIARALVMRPQVLFADEPTGALDTRAQRGVVELFAKLHEKLGTTYVVVTHDPAVARDLGDRTIHIVDGRIAEGAFTG